MDHDVGAVGDHAGPCGSLHVRGRFFLLSLHGNVQPGNCAEDGGQLP